MLLGAQAAGALSIAASGLARCRRAPDRGRPGGPGAGLQGRCQQESTRAIAHFVAGSACANCQLYQGKPGDASGDCPIFHKLVSAKGWCNSYVRRRAEPVQVSWLAPLRPSQRMLCALSTGLAVALLKCTAASSGASHIAVALRSPGSPLNAQAQPAHVTAAATGAG